eukprot:IDg4167t1
MGKLEVRLAVKGKEMNLISLHPTKEQLFALATVKHIAGSVFEEDVSFLRSIRRI